MDNLNKSDLKISLHKSYKFDVEKFNDLADYGVLLLAIADQFTFSESYKHFDKIKHLLKEI